MTYLSPSPTCATRTDRFPARAVNDVSHTHTRINSPIVRNPHAEQLSRYSPSDLSLFDWPCLTISRVRTLVTRVVIVGCFLEWKLHEYYARCPRTSSSHGLRSFKFEDVTRVNWVVKKIALVTHRTLWEVPILCTSKPPTGFLISSGFFTLSMCADAAIG